MRGQDADFNNLDLLYRASDGGSFNRFKTFSEELRLQGNTWNNQLDWLVGGYYAEREAGGRRQSRLRRAITRASATASSQRTSPLRRPTILLLRERRRPASTRPLPQASAQLLNMPISPRLAIRRRRPRTCGQYHGAVAPLRACQRQLTAFVPLPTSRPRRSATAAFRTSSTQPLTLNGVGARRSLPTRRATTRRSSRTTSSRSPTS